MKKLIILCFIALFMFPSVAQGSPRCSKKVCKVTLHATPSVKTWVAKESVKEEWLIFVNIRVGNESLRYRLISKCVASFSGIRGSARLTGCGKKPVVLDYVSYDRPERFVVEYRYIRS